LLNFNPRPGSHIQAMSKPQDTLSRPTPWREVVLVCRKCGKKQKGGFGEKRRDALKAHLRQALRAAGRRRDVRVIEISCLGVCPKHGVTALNASRPQTIHVIPAGTDAAVALRRLLGDFDAVADRDGIESA
jgi:predicted metal-binding protein